MTKHFANSKGAVYKTEEATPKCGDYCDACGDCLVCHDEDGCERTPDRKHFWVIYN